MFRYDLKGLNGSVTYYLWIKDMAGNLSLPATATIYIDRTAPVISNVVPDASSITSPRVGFTVTASDDHDGLENWCYVSTTNDKSKSTKVDLDGSKHGVYNIPMADQLLDKDYTLYFWAEDKNGNVSSAYPVTVTYTCPDRVKPVIQSFTATGSTNTKTVACKVAATDNTGITGYFVSVNNVTPTLSDSWTASGAYTINLTRWFKNW